MVLSKPNDFSMARLWPMLFNQEQRGNAVILLSQSGWCLRCRCLLQGYSMQGCLIQVSVGLGWTTQDTVCIIYHTGTWPLGSVLRPPYGFHLLYQSAGRSAALNFFALGWVLWIGLLLKLYTPFLLPSLSHTRILSFPPREVLLHNAVGKKTGMTDTRFIWKVLLRHQPRDAVGSLAPGGLAQESEEEGGAGPAKARLSQLFCS